MQLSSNITTNGTGIIFNPVNCQNQITEPIHQYLVSLYPKLKQKYHQFTIKYTDPDDRFGLIQLIKIYDDLYIGNAYTMFDPNDNTENQRRIDEYTLKETLTRFDTYTKRNGIKGYVPEQCVPNWNIIRQFIKENTNLTIIQFPHKKYHQN